MFLRSFIVGVTLFFVILSSALADRAELAFSNNQAFSNNRECSRDYFMLELLKWGRFGSISLVPKGGSSTLNFDSLAHSAWSLSQAPYQKPRVQDVAQLDPPKRRPGKQSGPTDIGLVFEEANAIKVAPIYDDGRTFAVGRPRAGLDKLGFEIFVDDDNDGIYDLKNYRDAQVDYSNPKIIPPVDPDILPSSARVLSRFAVGHEQDGYGYPLFFDFNASGYIRFNGFTPQIVGSSMRIAIHNAFGEDEDFPMFRRIYFRALGRNYNQLLGLVDSAGFTGVSEMHLMAGEVSRIHSLLKLYPRREINTTTLQPGGEPNTGFVGFSSMFWKGKDDTPENKSDQAHDCDVILVGFDTNGDMHPDYVVRQIIKNSQEHSVTDFGEANFGLPVYFALENQERNPEMYSDYKSAQYEHRSSYSVQLIRTTMSTSVVLHIDPANSEYMDNLVAYLAIRDNLSPAQDFEEGEEVEYIASAYFPKDSDGDGLGDQLEILLGTNPMLADSDGQGRSDYEERVVER